jgi:16S rRNA (cytosine967-C5)-methyltransferase
VAQGRAVVADEGSQLVALAAADAYVAPTEHAWLDMCAGPGGKATLLSALARQHATRVLAADIHAHRARLVASALGRAGVGETGAVVRADATRPPWRPETFDRVLLDAPCTGLGALRRRPEARWRRSPGDVAHLVLLQRRLLSTALDSVRVGGVVAYVTCSPHRDETVGVVEAVLAGRDDARTEPAAALVAHVPGAARGEFVQLWGDLHATDAMFLAVLRRTSRLTLSRLG